jgi:hypothetical protein
MQKNMLIRAAAISFGMAFLGFASGARAQDPPAQEPQEQQQPMQQQEDIPHPCAADADRLCKGVAVGGGAQLACLKAHKSELSPQCKTKILKAAEKHEEKKMEQPMQQPSPTP